MAYQKMVKRYTATISEKSGKVIQRSNLIFSKGDPTMKKGNYVLRELKNVFDTTLPFSQFKTGRLFEGLDGGFFNVVSVESNEIFKVMIMKEGEG